MLDRFRKWLKEYVFSYKEEDGSLNFLIKLKLDHSFRVAGDCRRIAKDLNWSDEDIILSETIGLLHDAGRFSQFAEYGTFHDPDSVDHGKRGFEVLKELDILKSCPETRETILECVHYHNRKEIPESVSEPNLRFLKLVRDADKLDIIKIVNAAINDDQHSEYPQIMMNIDMDGPVNPELLKEIRETQRGTYSNVKSLADINLMRMSWIYTLNYPPTHRLMHERNLLGDLLSTIPEDEEVRKITDDARSYQQEQVRKRMGTAEPQIT